MITDTMNPGKASRLRQQISRLRRQRESIETKLLRRRQMLRASFILRYLGTSRHKRRSPAFYLSFRSEGRTVLKYVAAKDRRRVKAKAEAWGQYQRLIARWIKVCKQIEVCWRSLGEAQSDAVNGDKSNE